MLKQTPQLQMHDFSRNCSICIWQCTVLHMLMQTQRHHRLWDIIRGDHMTLPAKGFLCSSRLASIVYRTSAGKMTSAQVLTCAWAHL